ncbi:radical SAM protein, partial [bacterium]|nr:radical SAM protein [bacterium]
MKKNKLDRKWIRISRSCNNNCIFCHDTDIKKKGFVPLNLVKKQLKEAKLEGFNRVVISGGEASIHPDFISILKYSKTVGFNHIQLITNGRIFAYKKLFIKSIKAGLDEITFSFHGHNAKLHDKQTRIIGSFKQSLCGLQQA